RVNAVSAGPVRTVAARSIPGFMKMFNKVGGIAPLGRNVTHEEVGNLSRERERAAPPAALSRSLLSCSLLSGGRGIGRRRLAARRRRGRRPRRVHAGPVLPVIARGRRGRP